MRFRGSLLYAQSRGPDSMDANAPTAMKSPAVGAVAPRSGVRIIRAPRGASKSARFTWRLCLRCCGALVYSACVLSGLMDTPYAGACRCVNFSARVCVCCSCYGHFCGHWGGSCTQYCYVVQMQFLIYIDIQTGFSYRLQWTNFYSRCIWRCFLRIEFYISVINCMKRPCAMAYMIFY